MFCLLLVFSSTMVLSQLQTTTQTTTPVYFAQCMVNVQSNQELTDLEQQLRNNPYVQIARVDLHTKRLFLLTKDLSQFSTVDFNSWLGTYVNSISCLQIGLHGIDAIKPYPFTDCN